MLALTSEGRGSARATQSSTDFDQVRVFVIGFHLEFAESEITKMITKERNHEKSAAVYGHQTTNPHGSARTSGQLRGRSVFDKFRIVKDQ